MKEIGMTKGGTVIVELNVTEARAFTAFGEMLDTLVPARNNPPQEEERAESVASASGATTITDDSGQRRTKADKTGKKRGPYKKRSEQKNATSPRSGVSGRLPGDAAKSAKGERLCVVCGKPTKSARKMTCSKACLLTKNRAAANAAYARKHPGSVTHKRKDAPAIPTQRASGSAPAASRVDRVDLIRQASERVNRLHDEEAG